MVEDTELVQNTHRNEQNGIIDKLRRLYRRTKIVEIPLDFEVSVNDQGRHVTEVFMTVGDKRSKVENINEFCILGSWCT